MIGRIKQLASFLPERCKLSLRRSYYAWQIRMRTFRLDPVEMSVMSKLVAPGDNVVDVGANVGHYSLMLSEAVGIDGHVFAIEPIPETFGLLTANSLLFPFHNVSLFNIAASDESRFATMSVPVFDSR